MKKKLISVLLVGVLAVSMSAGCGQKEDAKKDTKVSSEKKEKKEKKPEYKTIGTKEDEAYEVQLTNSTGQDITFVSFKSSSEENYPDTMLDEGDTETEDGKELPAEYTMKITLADNTELELHAFPFDDMKNGEIKVQDGIAYLTYEKDGSEVSTLESEKAVKEQKEAEEKAKAEAAAQAEAEAAAAAKAQAEAEAAAQAQKAAEAQKAAQSSQTQQRSTTSGQTSRPSNSGASSSGSASGNTGSGSSASNSGAATGGGSNEGCVDDGLTY